MTSSTFRRVYYNFKSLVSKEVSCVISVWTVKFDTPNLFWATRVSKVKNRNELLNHRACDASEIYVQYFEITFPVLMHSTFQSSWFRSEIMYVIESLTDRTCGNGGPEFSVLRTTKRQDVGHLSNWPSYKLSLRK